MGISNKNLNPRRISPVRQRQIFGLIEAASNTPIIVLEDQLLTYCTQKHVFKRKVGLCIPNSNRIIMKCEHLSSYSPTGSMYDRVYPWLFLRAEERGFISPQSTRLIECSIGNAGAAFAHVARELGYKERSVILPSDIYRARIDQVSNWLGTDVVFSPKYIGPLGYIRLLEEMLTENRENRKLNCTTLRLYPVSKIRKVPIEPYTAFIQEVKASLRNLGHDEHIHTFVFGIGAGNTISNIGHCIKSQNLGGQVIVAEHVEQPFAYILKSGGTPPVGTTWSEFDHPATTIHGVPLSKLNLDLSVIDDVILTTRDQRDEGLMIANDILGLKAGRPTGTFLWSAIKHSETVENSNILVPIFDSIAKYSSGAWEPICGLDLMETQNSASLFGEMCYA